jgi:hypothetical protein
MWHHYARASVLLCIWHFIGFSVPAQESVVPPLEYQVKAAFLLNFTRFIDWPPDSFATPEAPFKICIAGEDPFGSAIDQIVEGETVRDRKLVVHRLKRGAAEDCNVMFVAGSQTDEPPPSKRNGMLMVGESAGFLRDGGMIAFVLQDRRVRFDINPRAAQNAGLRISSKLLSVARNVEK